MTVCLLATPLLSVWHVDSGLFWFRALSEQGVSVILWDYRLSERPPADVQADFSLVLKGDDLDPAVLPGYKICYWPDDFDRTSGKARSLLGGYDKVLTMVRPTPDGMEWVPLGYDPLIHRAAGLSRHIPSLMVGTCTPRKLEYARAIQPALIVGNGWDVLEGASGPAYLHEYVALMNRARVIVNVHRSGSVGITRRFFEHMACGFTITDDVPGVREVLGDWLSDRVCYSSPENAREMVAYYEIHPDEREDLWRLEMKVIQPYSYECAVLEMVEKFAWR